MLVERTVLMFCKRCGKRVDTSASACPYCGRDVDAVSGGTGFWDLMKGAPESQDMQERHVQTTRSQAQPAHFPAGESRSGLDDAKTRTRPVAEDETARPAYVGGAKRRRRRAVGTRNSPQKRLAPIAIGILAICVVVLATLLAISRCAHPNQTPEEIQSTSIPMSVANESANGTSDEKGKKNGGLVSHYEASGSRGYDMSDQEDESTASNSPEDAQPDAPSSSSQSIDEFYGAPFARTDSTSVSNRSGDRNQLNGQQQEEGVQDAQ